MKNKIIKSIVAALLSASMLMSFAACGDNDSKKETEKDGKNAAADNATVEEVGSSTIDKNAKVGDYVTFGSYEQDNDVSNGKEAIEWLVLDIQDGKALLLSKYALEGKSYNKEYEAITWENCTLRSWLNNEFYHEAFSNAEKNGINTTTVVAEDNQRHGTEAGNDTQDKVFLLSKNEAEKYFSSDEERICWPTAYATYDGAWSYGESGSCWWWLRSPGNDEDNANIVSSTGFLGWNGDIVSEHRGPVRPAMWVSIG